MPAVSEAASEKKKSSDIASKLARKKEYSPFTASATFSGAAFASEADTVIVLEGTTAGDMGDVDKVRRVCEPGKGVTVSFMDHASIANCSLYQELMALADAKKIPHQVKRGATGGNDAGAYQRSKEGVRTCVLSVPCRYIHGPSSVVKLCDVESQYALARAYADQA